MQGKRLWIGNLWVVVLYCSFVLLMIGIICFTVFLSVPVVWNNSIIEKEHFITLDVLIILLLVILIWFDKDLWSYVVFSKKGIFLKRHGAVLQSYSQTDIRISYKVLYYKRRNIESLQGCLVIGGNIPSAPYIYDKNLRKSDYFAIVLTEKRLDQIVAFYKRSIELPSDLKSIQGKGLGVEKIKNFYKRIEEYNNTI
ncbi:MAG: hypothetical protein IKA20_01050 [Clostridia bacterium]|nr:hypothetical protein [Clostridia bacterium]